MTINYPQGSKPAIAWKSIGLAVGAVLLIGICILTVKFFSAQNNVALINDPAAPSVESSQLVYKNQKFGYGIELPNTWRGYTVTELPITNIDGSEIYGTLVTVHDPQSINATQPSYVPIAVFTIEQWDKWVATNFDGYPTAAPIGPTERGRNNKYVFATPPRFDFGFDERGYKQVNDAIATLKGFNI